MVDNDLILFGCCNKLNFHLEKSIRIFVSSTFTDTQLERNCIISKLLPELRNTLRNKFDIDLRIVDFRWGIRDEMTNDNLTEDICLNEIIKCKNESLSLFFITLLDQKVGFCSCPRKITVSEFQSIIKIVNDDDLPWINNFYKLDENEIPPSYMMRSKTELYDNFWVDSESQKCYWRDYSLLQTLLRNAVVLSNDIDQTRKQYYFQSITETEIRTALTTLHSSGNYSPIVWIRRNLIDVDKKVNDVTYATHSNFVELVKDSSDERFFIRDSKASANLNDLCQYLLTHEAVEQVRISSPITVEDLAIKSKDSSAKNNYINEFYNTVKNLITTKVEQACINMQLMGKTYDSLRMEMLKEEINHHLCYMKGHLIVDDLIFFEPIVSLIINEKDKNHMGLYLTQGESGCGLSTLSSCIGEAFSPTNFNEVPSKAMIIRFCGTTPDSTDITSLLISLTFQLNCILGNDNTVTRSIIDTKDHSDFSIIIKNWFVALNSFFAEDKNKQNNSNLDIGKRIIILDGIEKLHHDERLLDGDWIPDKSTLDSTCAGTLCISFGKDVSNNNQHISKCLEKHCNHFKILNVPNMKTNEIINGLLSALRCRFSRTLSPIQISYLQKIFDEANLNVPACYASFLALIVSKWRSGDSMDELKIKNLIVKIDCRSFVNFILEDLERLHGLLASSAFRFLTCARYGLSDDEIDELLSNNNEVVNEVFQYHKPPERRVPSLLWIRLRQNLHHMIFVRRMNGVYVSDWSSSLFSLVAKTRYLKDIKSQLTTHRDMIMVFKKQAKIINSNFGLRCRYLEEYPWHLLKCIELREVDDNIKGDEIILLQNLLEDPDIFVNLLCYYPDDLRVYWMTIIKNKDGNINLIMSKLSSALRENLSAKGGDDNRTKMNLYSDGALYIAAQYLEQTKYDSCIENLVCVLKNRPVNSMDCVNAYRLYALLEMRRLNFEISSIHIDSAENIIKSMSIEEQDQQHVVESLCDCELHRAHLCDASGDFEKAISLLEPLQLNAKFLLNPLKKSRLLMRLGHVRLLGLSRNRNFEEIPSRVINLYDQAFELASRYHEWNLMVDIESKRLVAKNVSGLLKDESEYLKMIDLCDKTKNYYFKFWTMHDLALFYLTKQLRQKSIDGFINTIYDALEHGESASSRVVESARCFLSDIAVLSTKGSSFEIFNRKENSNSSKVKQFLSRQLSNTNILDNSPRACTSFDIFADIPKVKENSFAVNFCENKGYLDRNLDNSSKISDSFVRNIGNKDDERIEKLVKLAMPVHGCTIRVLEKIIKSGSVMSQYRLDEINKNESDLLKTFIALTKSSKSIAFFNKHWHKDFELFKKVIVPKANHHHSNSKTESFSTEFEIALIAVVGKLQMVVHPDLGEYEKLRISNSIKFINISEKQIIELVQSLLKEDHFKNLSFCFGHSISIDSITHKSDSIFSILGPNAHFGGVSIIFNQMLLSHSTCHILAPGETTVMSGKFTKLHPFYNSNTKDLHNKKKVVSRLPPKLIKGKFNGNKYHDILSKIILNSSVNNWEQTLARIIGGSGRLLIDRLINEKHNLDYKKNDISSQSIIDLYMNHEAFIQREFNMEAQLPGIIPLQLVNHILISTERITGLDNLISILNDAGVLKKVRFFDTDELRVKWMQVYQSCDPLIFQRIKSQKSVNTTFSLVTNALNILADITGQQHTETVDKNEVNISKPDDMNIGISAFKSDQLINEESILMDTAATLLPDIRPLSNDKIINLDVHEEEQHLNQADHKSITKLSDTERGVVLSIENKDKGDNNISSNMSIVKEMDLDAYGPTSINYWIYRKNTSKNEVIRSFLKEEYFGGESWGYEVKTYEVVTMTPCIFSKIVTATREDAFQSPLPWATRFREHLKVKSMLPQWPSYYFEYIQDIYGHNDSEYIVNEFDSGETIKIETDRQYDWEYDS